MIPHRHGIVALHCVLQRRPEGVGRALGRPAAALLLGDVVFVGQVAGHILHAEGPHFLVVERLDGIHQVVRHLCGGVHRYFVKAHAALSMYVKKLRADNFLIAGSSPLLLAGLVVRGAVHLAGEHPEWHIDALDLLNVVIGGKRSRQQLSAFVILLERLDRLLLVYLERDQIIRPVHAREFARDHGGIAAVGAAGRRRRIVADQLCAAAGAVIGAHVGRIAPPAAVRCCFRGHAGSRCFRRCLFFRGGRFLLRFLVAFHSALVLFLVERLDFLGGIGAAAVVALELADLAIIVKGARTGRALINGDLFCHSLPP